VAGGSVNRDVTVAVAASVLPGTFPGDLGLELLEIEDESVRGRLIVDRRHLHPGGYVHGGVWVTVADTVAAWGTMRNLPPGKGFTTAELKMNVFNSGQVGDELLAVAEPLHRGRRSQVWEVRVSRSGRLAANFICTQMVLEGLGRREHDELGAERRVRGPDQPV
jgi:1,4-dihydroxy-2-naphthoyl-CoA hydrolase